MTAEELLDAPEKMFCFSSPKDGSQASTAALKSSYSCTTSPRKTSDKPPATVLCSVPECPSPGLGSAPPTAPTKAWQGLHEGRTTQVSWKTLRIVHRIPRITATFTPLCATDTTGRFQIHPKDHGYQPCFQKRCLHFGGPQSQFLPVRPQLTSGLVPSPQLTSGLVSSPPANFWS